MTLPEPTTLVQIVAGQLLGTPSDITGVSIDSRRSGPGDIFFALRGRHVDGHHFVGAALESGASIAVVERGFADQSDLRPLIAVDSPLEALQRLAAWYRQNMLDKVVAITGSNGKTIVKDALTAMLAGHIEVASSPGSFNSQIGVPLSILSARAHTPLCVFEVGISAPGEMEVMEELVAPNYGILTNIGLAHIGSFGTRQSTAAEKFKLFRTLGSDGWVLLPQGNSIIDEYSQTIPNDVTRHFIGQRGLPRIAHRFETSEETALTVSFPSGTSYTFSVKTRSPELIEDLHIALCAAHLLGVPGKDIAATLEGYSYGSTRMEIWRSPQGVTIINDACSADPMSVAAALSAEAASNDGNGRRIFLFGGMGELGEREDHEHSVIGTLAAKQGITHLALLDSPPLGHTAEAFLAENPSA
ncbi:MAG: UDP-N-acetylmuramoyl-tripeptide--D-alanyl-D-alanine ligase, partial [Proteobacteria bacterium]|nr:UDP-N-acetylmuramoyl-tripeptide--D-alanyl-D-alanine ligase [Pseudomonadota bacterium]